MSDDGDDDLDAFFEQVAAVEEEEQLPATKKQKIDETTVGSTTTTSTTVPTIRPKGIVVASSRSAVVAAPDNDLIVHSINRNQYIPPPPPLPPQQQQPEASINQNPTITKLPHKRAAAGTVWVDPTLADWPDKDFRIFVGNLALDVTDPELYAHFARYTSLAMVKIVKDSKTGASKGYGFCSFLDPLDCAKAIREMDQSWLKSRPIRIKRSDWKEREMKEVLKKKNSKKKQSKRFM